MRLWPRVKSNAGSPDVERCKHVKSQATTVYFRLGKLRRVYTYLQHMWGIIGHVTGNAVGTDGAPPQKDTGNTSFEEEYLSAVRSFICDQKMCFVVIPL